MLKRPILITLLLSTSLLAQAPAIVSRTPARNALNVPSDAVITVVFDQDIDGNTVNDSTFVVHGIYTGKLSGAYGTSSITATFTPTYPFKPGEQISVTLTTGIQNIGGVALALPEVWLFTAAVQGGHGTFAAAVNYGAGDAPKSVTAADLDGDGDIDLAVASIRSNNVSILLNNGLGSYATAVNYGAGSGPISVTAADLDGDGDMDLAAANRYSDNVSVLLNNGTGSYAAAVNYGVGDTPWSVTAADLDGDADMDLVVANFLSDNISVLLNNGSGSYAAAVNYNVGSHPMSVTAADLDGDGDADLAVANGFSDNLSVLLNGGSGNFAAAVNYGAGDSPYSVTAADLDGDGDIDLAVADTFSDNASVLLNNGLGIYAAAVNYSVGSRPWSVTAADLDGDGDTDLAMANYLGSNVSVLLNSGSGSYAAAVNYGVGYRPISVTAADLDGDGDSDLAVANETNNTVSVLLNVDLTPPAAPSGLAVTDSTDGTIILLWDKNTEADILHYRVYGGTATAPTTVLESTTSAIDTTITIAGLVNGIKYYFRITAVDSSGNESVYSAEVSATPIDLVAYYPFNGNADDESGNGNNGTLIGDTYFIADRFGNEGSALSLTGTGYVELPDGAMLDRNTQATFATWLNTKATDTQSHVVIASGDSRGGLDPFVIKIRNNQVEYIEFLNTINNDHIRLSSSDVSFVLNNDEWYHLSSVLSTTASGSKLEVFINGSLVADTTLTDTISIRYDVPMATFIGSIHGLHPWIGYLDDIRIYNRDLSATEIDSLYQLGGWLGIADKEERRVPTDFALHQNYPNPFNPTTTIRFDLPMATDIHIVVYDLLGREVVRLADGRLEAGYQVVVWNCRDSRGRPVPSGLYFARLFIPPLAGVTPGYTKTIKLLLLR